ncbi:MAG: AIR synthase-related protein, partial [Planctomycetota bacterium]
WQAHLEVSHLIRSGNVTAAHDVSDGGWLVAAAEMAIGGDLGLDLNHADVPFDEPMTTYLLAGRDLDFGPAVETVRLGTVVDAPRLKFPDGSEVTVADCRRAWRGEGDAEAAASLT